jgi:CBS domain-containing protein
MTDHTPTSLTLGRSTVRGAMQLGLFECTPDTDLRTLAGIMAEKSIHCVVVASPTWGIASDLDLMRGLSPGLDETTAGDVAATDTVVIAPDDTLEHAAQLMAEHETRPRRRGVSGDRPPRRDALHAGRRADAGRRVGRPLSRVVRSGVSR